MAPRLIVRNGAANTLSYQLGATQQLHVESVSLTVDTTAAGSASYIDVLFLDQSGTLIAQSRSSQNVNVNEVATVTMAPDLPDTAELGLAFVGNVNTSGLVDTVLPPLSSVEAQASDPAALVTQLRLWVTDAADTDAELAAQTEAFGPWAYVPGPGA